MSHKKRKFAEEDERSLHHVFAAAAKAVTALYASAERENKKSRMQSRQLLERQFQWVLREYGTQETIPTRALLNYLQLEAQNIEEQEGGTASGVAQPVLPSGQQRQMTSAFQAFADKPLDEQPKYS